MTANDDSEEVGRDIGGCCVPPRSNTAPQRRGGVLQPISLRSGCELFDWGLMGEVEHGLWVIACHCDPVQTATHEIICELTRTFRDWGLGRSSVLRATTMVEELIFSVVVDNRTPFQLVARLESNGLLLRVRTLSATPRYRERQDRSRIGEALFAESLLALRN